MARPSASSTWNGSGTRASVGMLGASACSSDRAETATSADDTSPLRSSMQVAVVIPAYNEARRLPSTLAAWREFLAAQAFDAELIVVNDGSRDETSAVARNFGV